MGWGENGTHMYRRRHNQTTLKTVNKVPSLGTPCTIWCKCTLQLLTFTVTHYSQLFNLRTAVHYSTKAGRAFRGQLQVQLCNTWLWLGMKAWLAISEEVLRWGGTQNSQDQIQLTWKLWSHDHLPLPTWVVSKLEWTATLAQHHQMIPAVPGQALPKHVVLKWASGHLKDMEVAI